MEGVPQGFRKVFGLLGRGTVKLGGGALVTSSMGDWFVAKYGPDVWGLRKA